MADQLASYTSARTLGATALVCHLASAAALAERRMQLKCTFLSSIPIAMIVALTQQEHFLTGRTRTADQSAPYTSALMPTTLLIMGEEMWISLRCQNLLMPITFLLTYMVPISSELRPEVVSVAAPNIRIGVRTS
jgi:hypothetical protein